MQQYAWIRGVLCLIGRVLGCFVHVTVGRRAWNGMGECDG
jgi:hypothetical protein